ncbi:hypothetical protein GLU64_02965 [Nanohaloarchaea archaeon]|nr:hypothetical protein [Candidatus Nanohaloarchaea archaeon]
MQQTYFYVGFSAVLAAVSIFLTSLLYQSSLILTALLAAVSGAPLILWNKREDLFFYSTGFVGGPLAEIICIYFGAWSYSSPDLLGIPLWLPFAWGKVTLIMGRSDVISEQLFN